MQSGPSGPAVGSPSLQDMVKKLEDRSYKTFKARMRASQRLARRNSAWNVSLVAFSTATTVAAVGMLTDRDMYGPAGDTIMAALGILSLITSLIVASMNYGSRSRALEANYKHIQRISLKAEGFFIEPQSATADRYEELFDEYSAAIESSENHSDGDYASTLNRVPRSSKSALWIERLVTWMPYLSILAPIGILAPFVTWLRHAS